MQLHVTGTFRKSPGESASVAGVLRLKSLAPKSESMSLTPNRAATSVRVEFAGAV